MSGDAEPVDEAEAALDHDMDLAELPLTDFKLPPARELDESGREGLVQKAISRIREGAKDLAAHDMFDVSDGQAAKTTPTDMWMLLLVRMVTRVSDPAASGDEDEDVMKDDDGTVIRRSDIYDRQDRLRHALVEYIMADFSGRYVCCRSTEKGGVNPPLGYDSPPVG